MAFNSIRLHQDTRNSDISAFEKLFKKYYAALVKYAFSYVKDIDASEEIVQDFFYNYWKNRKKINIRLSVKSYLYRAIRNNSLKYLEAQAVRRRYAEKVLETASESVPEPDTDIELTELNELIEETLDMLPDRCGQIFRMSRYEGLKYDEIASRLSISVKTVEANMGKALKLLRERLGNHYRTDTNRD